MKVSATSYAETTHQVAEWAGNCESRYVCAANVHMVMESHDSVSFRRTVNSADLVTPDGMPLVWTLRLMGVRNQGRVYGPELTLRVCEMAEQRGLPVALYGGTDRSLQDFVTFLRGRYPALQIPCAIAPPFRTLTPAEDEVYTRQLVESGARILFVGIGCPKQETWMRAHQARVPAVMIGIGAAFDFHSGRVKQAPAFIQKIGMEWFFRLVMEPRRLWRRYLKHNPRFVTLVLLQLLRIRHFSSD